MSLRVLTWNLFHGRSRPGLNHDLFDVFAAQLAGWRWDVALLQEVPPWWPAPLARACDAEERHVLTSRNALLPLRRLLAQAWPDLMKSNGGGCNAILVRGRGGVAIHARRRLRWVPERRWVHAVLDGEGTWFANLHATAGIIPSAHRDIDAAFAAAACWSQGAPLVFGGDLNVKKHPLPGMRRAGGNHVDHIYARGLRRNGPVELLDAGGLSDHAPVRIELTG